MSKWAHVVAFRPKLTCTLRSPPQHHTQELSILLCEGDSRIPLSRATTLSVQCGCGRNSPRVCGQSHKPSGGSNKTTVCKRQLCVRIHHVGPLCPPRRGRGHSQRWQCRASRCKQWGSSAYRLQEVSDGTSSSRCRTKGMMMRKRSPRIGPIRHHFFTSSSPLNHDCNCRYSEAIKPLVYSFFLCHYRLMRTKSGFSSLYTQHIHAHTKNELVSSRLLPDIFCCLLGPTNTQAATNRRCSTRRR